MSTAFFSENWCDHAMEASNANPAIVAGFKNAGAFSHTMLLQSADGPATKVVFDQGRITSWTPDDGTGDYWAVMSADAATWRHGVESGTPASQLLLGGRIRLVSGPMAAAIENAKAFDAWLGTWSKVDTEWSEA